MTCSFRDTATLAGSSRVILTIVNLHNTGTFRQGPGPALSAADPTLPGGRTGAEPLSTRPLAGPPGGPSDLPSSPPRGRAVVAARSLSQTARAAETGRRGTTHRPCRERWAAG